MSQAVEELTLRFEKQDRAILELMAVLTVPLTRSALVDWLKVAGLRRSETRAYSSQDVGVVLGRLRRLELVEDCENGRTFAVAETSRHAILANALREDRLLALAELVRRQQPLQAPHAYYPAQEAAIREFALSLHLGLSDELKQCFEKWAGNRARETWLVAGVGAHPPLAGLSQLPSHFIDEYLAQRTRSALEQLALLPARLLDWADERLAQLGTHVREQLAFVHTLRGDPARAQRLMAGLDTAAASALHAFVSLSCGEIAEARRLAREAVERTRTKSSKRLRGLDSCVGSFLVLMLLTDPDPTSQLCAHAQLAHASQSKAPAFHSLMALQAHLGMLPRTEGVDSVANRSASWEAVLFDALLTRIKASSLGRSVVDRLESWQKLASAGELTWLAQALQAVASPAMSHPLLRLHQTEEPWRRTLRALESAADSGERRPDVAAERFCWNFALASDGRFELSARLQTRQGSGWSSGRVVALKRLAETRDLAHLMSDGDRRVVQHVRCIREGGYYGGSVSYQLDPAAARELVGHPLVFADGNYSTPLEVIEGRCRVEVRTRGDKLELMLAPEQLLQSPVVCAREGAARLVVYTLDVAQQRVADVFRRAPIELPLHARDTIHHTLVKLATRFALTADHEIAAQQIEEVAADGRPRVRMRRRGAGLAIRLCVVPLEGCSALSPGEGDARHFLHLPGDDGAKAVCALRDLAAERAAQHALYRACPTLADAMGGDHEAHITELDRCLELLCELQACAALIEWPEGEPLRLAPERDVRDLRLSLSSAADWLSADGELEVDETLRLSLHELLARNAAARGRFIALADDRFMALTDTLRKRLDALSALARIDGDSIALHPLWVSLTGAQDDYAELRCDASTAALLERAREAQRSTPLVPPGFQAELRPYQREGFEWLVRLAHMRAGGCLADDMGLGKTLQALALLLSEAAHGPSLVVAPTSVCPNWLEEARRFAPGLRVRGLSDGDRAATIEALGPHDVLVTSFGLVQQEIARLATKHFRVVVIDEAQAIKNAATLRARSVQQLVADIRIALTGTPVENHLGELWSLMHFLNPGLLGSRQAFDERFTKPITRDGDWRASHTLKRLMRPFVLRRHKSEVLDDLPAKTVITLQVEPSDEERALQRTLRERALAKLGSAKRPESGELRIQLLAELMRLRRAACHPQLVAPELALESSKLAVFESLLGELREGGHKVLVFSQFIDYLALVRQRLEALGVSYQYLDGSCSAPERQRSVAAFQGGEGDVFLISLKAGGFGLNLTAADYVIHLDPWWNPAVEEQASDRAHRLGQTRPVTIYRLVMRNSIEEKILALHAHKRDLADRVLEGTGQANVSLDDLLALISPESAPTTALGATPSATAS
jgi:superfamily II DNA or RNA helicase